MGADILSLGQRRILSLLQSHLRCLDLILQTTREFGVAAQNGELSQLDRFQAQREASIRALGLYDDKITEAVKALPLAERSAEFVNRVRLFELSRTQALAAVEPAEELGVLVPRNVVEDDLPRL